ncbi:arylesterase [Shewanella mesophila]|uniref:GDSL-type esterase/lipase family protein n=1 Tax=Shewanella mesophila TaxID=2864208 RepID=UPI001C65B512|nr:GDSL-type esterase/lipase family protein [Shewanella mesophila]QYJ86998.1 arylesterase [Shewanella mesophila]
MKFKWLLVVVAMVIVGVFWPNNNRTLAPLSPDANILAFGDSLTQGVGASKGNDYPSVLARLTGCNVVNYGISGETTAEGLRRFATVLDETSPELVLLLEGGNDFLRNVDESEVEANLSLMIEQAQSRSIAVVLIAVPQKSIWLEPAKLYSRLSDKYQLLLIEDFLTELLKLPEVKSDTIHLNDLGYRRLAKHIEQQLRHAGAL